MTSSRAWRHRHCPRRPGSAYWPAAPELGYAPVGTARALACVVVLPARRGRVRGRNYVPFETTDLDSGNEQFLSNSRTRVSTATPSARAVGRRRVPGHTGRRLRRGPGGAGRVRARWCLGAVVQPAQALRRPAGRPRHAGSDLALTAGRRLADWWDQVTAGMDDDTHEAMLRTRRGRRRPQPTGRRPVLLADHDPAPDACRVLEGGALASTSRPPVSSALPFRRGGVRRSAGIPSATARCCSRAAVRRPG